MKLKVNTQNSSIFEVSIQLYNAQVHGDEQKLKSLQSLRGENNDLKGTTKY